MKICQEDIPPVESQRFPYEVEVENLMTEKTRAHLLEGLDIQRNLLTEAPDHQIAQMFQELAEGEP